MSCSVITFKYYYVKSACGMKAITVIFYITLVATLMLLAGCGGKDATREDTPMEQQKGTVVIETSKGIMEVVLEQEKAPVTVSNFLSYVNSGFYDGTVFHRVIPGFRAQGGGFNRDGTEKPTSQPIKLESNNGLKNTAGTIAMARTSVPDSATSQFFINVADNSFLDYAPGNDGYAVFGRVISGMDVVKSIESVKTGNKGPNSDWPVENVVITKAYVKK